VQGKQVKLGVSPGLKTEFAVIFRYAFVKHAVQLIAVPKQYLHGLVQGAATMLAAS
jgi:hypothetical protein